jgi:hypothetical protein
MVKFGGLMLFVAVAVLLAVFASGSGFLGVGLLAALVGCFALLVTVFNELRRTLN